MTTRPHIVTVLWGKTLCLSLWQVAFFLCIMQPMMSQTRLLTRSTRQPQLSTVKHMPMHVYSVHVHRKADYPINFSICLASCLTKRTLKNIGL